MCTSPLRAFYTGSKTEKGGDLLAVSKTFSGLSSVRYSLAQKVTPESFPVNKDFMYLDNAGYWQLYKFVDVPCGNCLECKAAYARQWAARCVLEWRNSKDCWFITLTYADNPGSVSTRDFQLFMKRLRKICGKGVRFFACLEYGEHTHRPHAHAVLFNCPLTLQGVTAKEIRQAWPFGMSTVDCVTFDRCAYVARYTSKKLINFKLPEGYEAPRVLMSRRPGIGERWLSENMDMIFKADAVYLPTSSGKPQRSQPPRYFYKLAEKAGYQLYDVKDAHQVAAVRASDSLKSLYGVDDEDLLSAKRHFSEERMKRHERDSI